MRVLILGGSGMLGHRLWVNLRREHETWITVRDAPSQIPERLEFPRKFIRPFVNALNFDEVTRALASIQPDLVINCIGLVKQRRLVEDPLSSIALNAMLPHRLSLICRTAKIRMIHISTDCVFSGKKGNYVEEDQSDAEDIYGKTKYLGEVRYSHAITLRTSIIGRELKSHLGLIEWFLAQRGTIRGYQKSIYSGLTTDELSRIIMRYVIPHPELSGVYHVSSDPISKYELLRLANETLGKGLEILPDSSVVCDRSLNSSRFRQQTGYAPPPWTRMITDLVDHLSLYKAREDKEKC